MVFPPELFSRSCHSGGGGKSWGPRVGSLTSLVPPAAGGPERAVSQSVAKHPGEMKTCLLPGVALCLLLGPLAGEQLRCLFMPLGTAGAGGSCPELSWVTVPFFAGAKPVQDEGGTASASVSFLLSVGWGGEEGLGGCCFAFSGGQDEGEPWFCWRWSRCPQRDWNPFPRLCPPGPWGHTRQEGAGFGLCMVLGPPSP